MSWEIRVAALVFIVVTCCSGSAVHSQGFVPNDPDFHLQWGLRNAGQTNNGGTGVAGADISAPEAWAIHWGTPSVTVAIVGRGIDPHPQFSERLLPGTATVGDPFDAGDACANDTHLAGIIAAATNDGSGVAGINGRARIMPIRAFDGCGVTQINMANGIRAAVDLGADIILAAVQFANLDDVRLCDAVAYATSRDVLVVAPAGHNELLQVTYPGRCAGAIAVSATDQLDETSAASNSGPEVDLAAPGVEIWSTWIEEGYAYLPEVRHTHAAAAMVAGVASLVMSYAPQLTAEEVAEVLFQSADDLGAVGWDEHFGHGRVNAAAALALATEPPLRFEHIQTPPWLLPPGFGSSITVRIADGTQIPVPSSQRVWLRSNFTAYTPVPLVHLFDDVYRVDLPGNACTSVFQYYLAVTGHAGTLVTDPPAAPGVVYTAQVAFDEAMLRDDFEEDRGWTSEGGDNTSGIWSRVVPVGTDWEGGTYAQPGYDATHGEGRHCYVTGQHFGGSIGSNDVDGQLVTLTSPLIPLPAPSALVEYSYWFFTSHPDGPDRLTVELSLDDGTTWAVAREHAHTGAWRKGSIRLVDFPALVGDELRVRYSTVDVDSPSLVEAAVDEVRVIALTCSALMGDGNSDGVIGAGDAAHLPPCVRGPGRDRANGPCSRFDFNHDFRADLGDVAEFQRVYGTP